MVIIQNISFAYPAMPPLFEKVYLTVEAKEKIAIIGSNGSGKSTLLKIIAQQLTPNTGQLTIIEQPYYIPQIHGQYDHLNVAEALGVSEKLNALKSILEGNTMQENFDHLNEDWTIEERCIAAMAFWDLQHIDLNQSFQTLSGGEKTKVFLAGILIHKPHLILLDEPTNHLDVSSKLKFYDWITMSKSTIIAVSHDRQLLNLLATTYELNNSGLQRYGGNYNFYKQQKTIELKAKEDELHAQEKALRSAKEIERSTKERQNKLDNRGKAKQSKAGVAKIMMNTLRNNAEQSTAKITDTHASKIASISKKLQSLRTAYPEIKEMGLSLQNANLHEGKILVKATDINKQFNEQYLWNNSLNFEIRSGQRLAICGNNGTGKTTLIKIIQGIVQPTYGQLYLAKFSYYTIDQDYSAVYNNLTVYEQALSYNKNAKQEHEIKIVLHRFLFTKEDWNKKCNELSGGEKLRLLLSCLNITEEAPDMIILDEPTNNLDLQNLAILTEAIKNYQGTLVVISHDKDFLIDIGIDTELHLNL